MIKDYKGEMPKNVITPEKAKAKKPFYQDWKFWVLTGLMTLFGACSIYGLVLGSQYVKAIERASHIIADAQGSEINPVKKGITRALPANNVKFVDLGDLDWSVRNYDVEGHQYWVSYIDDITIPRSNSLPPSIVCGAFESLQVDLIYAHYTNNCIGVTYDKNVAIYTNQFTDWDDPDGFKTFVGGVLCYYRSSSYGDDDAYSTIFEEGYQDGYQEGYQEGYSDGSDAINVNQYFRVVMPVGDYSVQYESFINGVSDDQGQIVGGSTSPNYREFTRNRNQVLRVDLTLPTNYNAFWLYTPYFTSGFPTDDNVSLQQSWSVNGVTYLPTWVGSVQLYVNVTGASVPDLTYQTISVAFDVAHWGDIKVGAYQQGYQQGYVDGQENPTAYNNGYDAGYADGQAQGETDGFNRGVAVGSSGSQSLAMMFKTAFQLPFDQLYRFLNFNLLGINFLSLFTALISVSIGIMVIKKVL